ncbi:MAG: ECF transporter S component [Oscillospiraceae bacterium]
MKKQQIIRKICVTAVLSAAATVLMFLSFNVPLMPSFIKLDFSELPALVAAFSLGPVSGITVCLVKNLVNLMFSTTGGVGELSNFILGCLFVVPAGIIYSKVKNRRGAVIGAILGAVLMAFASVLTNYYVIYPVYTMFMPMDAIISAYQLINHEIENLWQALLIFNMPFTFIKGMLNVLITFLIYKKISPILKGKNK